jgi:hypothetical protein
MTYYGSLKIKLILLTIVLFGIFLPQTVLSQEKQTEKALEKFILQLKSAKIDTFLIFKSGCFGCEIIKSDTSKATIDGQNIYVLAQKSGHSSISIFNDLNEQINFKTDTCSVFEFVFSIKPELLKKDIFYKNQIPKVKSKNGFLPPRPVHFSYADLKVYSPNFIYELNIINDNNDSFGLKPEKEKWFILTKEIIKRVENQFK